MSCPCGSKLKFEKCCKPFIDGAEFADTPEKLMRSRYSAYTKANVDYLGKTVHGSAKKSFDAEAALEWAKQAKWNGLEVKESHVEANGHQGIVEFIASFTIDGKPQAIHERAEFNKVGDKWYYTDGKIYSQNKSVKNDPKVSRNDPCPCGSGLKYKKCCINKK